MNINGLVEEQFSPKRLSTKTKQDLMIEPSKKNVLHGVPLTLPRAGLLIGLAHGGRFAHDHVMKNTDIPESVKYLGGSAVTAAAGLSGLAYLKHKLNKKNKKVV